MSLDNNNNIKVFKYPFYHRGGLALAIAFMLIITIGAFFVPLRRTIDKILVLAFFIGGLCICLHNLYEDIKYSIEEIIVKNNAVIGRTMKGNETRIDIKDITRIYEKCPNDKCGGSSPSLADTINITSEKDDKTIAIRRTLIGFNDLIMYIKNRNQSCVIEDNILL